MSGIALATHVTVVPIFPNWQPGPTRLVIPAAGRGLRYDSVLVHEELTTIEKAHSSGKVRGRATEQLLDEVIITERREPDFSA